MGPISTPTQTCSPSYMYPLQYLSFKSSPLVGVTAADATQLIDTSKHPCHGAINRDWILWVLQLAVEDTHDRKGGGKKQGRYDYTSDK